MTPDPFNADRTCPMIMHSVQVWQDHKRPFYKRLWYRALDLWDRLRGYEKPRPDMTPGPPCYGNHQWSDWRESTHVVGEKWRRCQREGCHIVGFIILPGARPTKEVVWHTPN